MDGAFIMPKLTEQLIRHEGLRLKPYKDTVGKLTIGIGRNLDDVGITRDEALMLLENDIKIARDELLSNFPSFNSLQDARLDCLINMVFNMGISRFKGFKLMIAALGTHEYNEAAVQMLDSKWARQVGKRATELSVQMRLGYYANTD